MALSDRTERPAPLDPAAEQERFRAYQQSRDPALREDLVVRYLYLVPPIVRRFRGRAEWEDLVQVGYLGLLKAVDAFDCAQNNRFSTYATHCISGELRHYIRDRVDSIRKPRWLAGLSRQVAAFIEKRLHETHRLPTFAEISKALNISEEGVVEILKARAPMSLDALESGDANTPGVSVEKIRSKHYESFRLPIEDRISLMQALERLVDLERNILYLFFYRDLTQSQIAGQMNLPPKKVSRLMRKGLDRLKEILTRDIF